MRYKYAFTRALGLKKYSYYRNYNELYTTHNPDWTTCQRSLKGIYNLGIRHNFKSLLVIIPDMNFPFPYFYRFRKIHKIVAEYAHSIGLPVIDLLPIMESSGIQSWDLISPIPGQGHPNAFGYRMIADNILIYLSSMEYLPFLQ